MRTPPSFLALGLLGVLSCTGPAQNAPEGRPEPGIGAIFRVHGAKLPGGAQVDLWIEGGRIREILGPDQPGPEQVFDASGRWLSPAMIDAHVHLAYAQGAPSEDLGCRDRSDDPSACLRSTLAKAGFGAVVDLAAPIPSLDETSTLLTVINSGPMLTKPMGYPTQSWGQGGYGLEVPDPAAAVAAVDRLVAAGAGVIKVPLDEPELDLSTLTAIVTRAHHHGKKVLAHALSEAGAARGAEIGCDVLAHTPTETLSDATVAAWSGKVVISTLTAFGKSRAAVDNLRRLHQAGATVLYGTDLGNRRIEGLDPDEVRALSEAGLSSAEIFMALTREPAQVFGLDTLGELSPGRQARFLVLAADPAVDPGTLLSPLEVWVDGAPLLER
ncbi:MAG: amidohydrolase family protein [Deltaproteobacteria bacterium]|nr:amidohydrolase family protein [Deltaproteobacteria bacterium]